MESFDIPVIDFSSPDRQDTARQLIKAMEATGFVYIDNIPGFDQQSLKQAALWFFSLPLEKRLQVAPKKYNKESKGIYRGYYPLIPEDTSLKEFFECAGELSPDDPLIKDGHPLYESTPWPEEDTLPFREIVMKHFDAMSKAATEFVQLACIGIGLDEHSFDKMFVKPVSTLRLSHYPARSLSEAPEKAIAKDGSVLTCNEHCDSGCVTLLATFENEGLQLFLDGKWVNVKLRPHSVVVNIGNLFSLITNGRLKATMHRVVDIGRDRYSVPFFFSPSYHAEVPTSDSCTQMYGPWMINRVTKGFPEYTDAI